MKLKRTHRACLTVLVWLTTTFIASSQVQIPSAINYQGKLTDDLGDALTNGFYMVEFRIWKDPSLSGPSELAWGRSFPVHVVEGGLFNVLLTDDGSIVDGVDTEILGAFDGPERYLGLTIVQDPNGVVQSPGEISPRQRLVSAPYTIQAQTANTVATDGVSNSSLANGSVTTAKIMAGNVTSGTIANGAVTNPKLANNAVTTGKIMDGQVTGSKIAPNAIATDQIVDGAVTSAKLNIDDGYWLNDKPIYLRLQSSTDTNHALIRAGSFAGQSVDGPALYGWTGGVLGTTRPPSGTNYTPKVALSWKHDGSVNINNGPVSVFGGLESKTMGTKYTATTDGFIVYFGFRGHAEFKWWKVGNNTSTPDIDRTQFFNVSGNDSKMISWPVAKGEKWQLVQTGTSSGWYSELYWRPLGSN